ncbi:MAG TPA: PQQ-binding-like beta-propeller repeat protein [Acidobacteriota bacterium]|nr:PQQ-binding-like beta-propeller repeat protein [Acidobacteriota bacterium]
MPDRELKHPRPFLLSLTSGKEVDARVARPQNRFEQMTLGDLDLVAQVRGLEQTDEAETALILPYDPRALQGLERSSVRVFRYDGRRGTLRAVWNSGINLELGYVWAKVQQPGTYVPIGLPRDRVLQEALRELAYQRSLRDLEDAEAAKRFTLRFWERFFKERGKALQQVRALATRFEIATTHEVPLEEYNFGEGGHPEPFHLPRGESLDELRERLAGLEVLAEGLPEEQLFRPPELSPRGGSAWALNPQVARYDLLERQLSVLDFKIEILPLYPWLFSKDWPMYQHDIRHSGAASGSSSINSTTVGQLAQRFKVNLDGPVNSKPSIVSGKAYIGTSQYGGGSGGTLYKINLCSGCIEGQFPTNDAAFYSIRGIGGSPAIYKGKVYFTTVGGKVYCLDASTMTTSAPHPAPLWVTDLKNPDAGKKQPVDNPSGDCWSSPLVVNDKVYVGSGEGEDATCWGFAWCLDANNGQVQWLFCTNKAQDINNPGNENVPNRIPRSAAVSDPLPGWATAAGFSLMDDPPETGSSPWSSFAYDSVHQQVYIGTGNSEYAGGLGSAIAPDQRYGSGLIALDANTGDFRGFHTSQPDDSYHPNDSDIDSPGAPTVFSRGGQRVVCYGCKNGSFFLLDAGNLSVLGGGAQRRQLLARENGSGHPGNRGNPIPGVATGGGLQENKWGVMATPAIHYGLGTIYVGLGGYSGAGDGTKTPFIRALDWNNLNDAWPTALGGDGVTRYTLANPPVYQRPKEAALSSPAVVNDVVFVSTTDPDNNDMSLYALDAATGLCLWAAPKVPGGGWPNYALGPAVSGEYVAAGAGSALYIYTRPSTPWCIKPLPWYWEEIRWPELPWPPVVIDRTGG